MSETENLDITEEQTNEGAQDEAIAEPEEFDLAALPEDEIANLSDEDLEKLRNLQPNQEGDTPEEETTDEGQPEEKTEDNTKNLTAEERIASLEKQIKDLEKVKKDRGDYIEKQSSTIESLKSKLDSLQQTKTQLDEASSNEQFWKAPQQAMKAELQKDTIEKQIQDTERELAYRNQKAVIDSQIPDFADIVDDIVEYFKVIDPKGTTDEAIAQFKKDPYAMNPQAAFQAYTGAKLLKEVQKTKLEKELESEKSRRAINKVNNAAQYRTATAGPSGASSNSLEAISDSDIANMSDEDLASYTKKLKKLQGR